MRIAAAIESWPIARPFTTARGTKLTAHVVVATITDGNVVGRGECVPYPRYGDDTTAVATTINDFHGPFDRRELLDALPAGPARNAIDCALWDLEAKRRGQPAWQLAGVPKPVDIPTAFTLPLDSASTMGQQTTFEKWRPLLKVKLGSDDVAADIERLRLVRAKAPGVRLIVDANEGWNMAALAEFAPVAAALGVELIEQPLPEGDDQDLAGFQSPVPLAADESIRDGSNLAALAATYQIVNIKLDKTGGLTRALDSSGRGARPGPRHHGRLHGRHVAVDGTRAAAGWTSPDRGSRWTRSARRRSGARPPIRFGPRFLLCGSVGLTGVTNDL